MSVKKKPPVLQRSKQNDMVNKRAIIWVSVGIVAVIVVMTVLLIVNS